MNHYCTYFDRGFLAQGLALWRSLSRHDPDSALWVLALDDETADALGKLGGTWLRVMRLGDLEAADPELTAAKAGRTRVEYTFTLSPCWPRHLLRHRPEIGRITYLDADLLFFGSPAPVFDAMDAAGASVLVTEHRFPPWLRHYEQHGRFNVGVLSFRDDAAGRGCLDHWRGECLAWCHDRVEPDRYADQKYLDAWPARLGPALLVLDHPGVNLAPWNWMNHELTWAVNGDAAPPLRAGSEPGRGRPGSTGQPTTNGALLVDGEPLVAFHFARFRAHGGGRWWQSGQLDYGVMPWRLRQFLYGAYWRALEEAAAEIRRVAPGWMPPARPARLDRGFWRALPLRLVFGSDWLRVGDTFVSGRLGLGRYSGRVLALLRTIFLRR